VCVVLRRLLACVIVRSCTVNYFSLNEKRVNGPIAKKNSPPLYIIPFFRKSQESLPSCRSLSADGNETICVATLEAKATTPPRIGSNFQGTNKVRVHTDSDMHGGTAVLTN
jgi:hypothetical protein